MKAHHLIIKISFFTFILSLHSLPLNISKLKLRSMNIKNTKQHKNKIIVKFDKCCPQCSSCYQEKKSFSLEPQKNISISDKHGIIHSITSINPEQTFRIFPVHIKDFWNQHYKKFKTGMPENVSAQEFIDTQTDIYKRNNLSQLFLNLPQNLQQEVLHKKPRIPRIIHKVWLGMPMPNLYKNWKRTWRKMHPGWRFICWTEKMLEKHFPDGLYNQITFDNQLRKNNYASMADVFRYEILYRYGGVYCDADMICFEPFDILNQLYDFFAVLQEMRWFLSCANGVFGAKPQHPILLSAIEFIKEYENKEIQKDSWAYDTKQAILVESISTRTGPILLTKAIINSMDKNNNIDIVFPYNYFLPANTSERRGEAASFCYHDHACPEVKDHYFWTKNSEL